MRWTGRSLLLLLGVLGGAGCGGGSDVGCTADFRYGLTVTVIDDASGQRVCDATVRASEGTYQETLMPLAVPSECVYVGAGERAGTYSLSAQKTGFQPATQAAVVVERDTCHVKGAVVTLRLKR